MMIPPYYAILAMKLDRIAMRRGWNMCLHGSMTRDLDLVLIPWTEDAEPIDKLVDDIRLFVEGTYVSNARKKADKKRGVSGFTGLEYYAVTNKPHGRKSITINIGFSDYYLDISIMPRIEKVNNG
jgi:hypothetical protein